MTDNDGAEDAVVIERSFDAPVDLIWQMWTDPEHFKAWYGPDGTTIPVAQMDVRVGGIRLVCMEMQSPDGPMQMWFTGEYREVVENERLVYTETMSDENGNVSSPSDVGMTHGHPMTTEVRIELEDVGGRTKLVMTHAGVPGDSPGATGWTMALDKLAAHIRAHSDR
ncbi:MAG: SRPBCC family protein [Acidimicrobiales bacterium]